MFSGAVCDSKGFSGFARPLMVSHDFWWSDEGCDGKSLIYKEFFVSWCRMTTTKNYQVRCVYTANNLAS